MDDTILHILIGVFSISSFMCGAGWFRLLKRTILMAFVAGVLIALPLLLIQTEVLNIERILL